jgi:hypothetical protein
MMPEITEESLREFLDWHTKVKDLDLLSGMSGYTAMRLAFEAGWQARKAAETRPEAGQELLEPKREPASRRGKTEYTRYTVSSPATSFQGRQSPYFEQPTMPAEADLARLEAETRATRAATTTTTFDPYELPVPPVADWAQVAADGGHWMQGIAERAHEHPQEPPAPSFMPAPAAETTQFPSVRAIDDSFDHLETVWKSESTEFYDDEI